MALDRVCDKGHEFIQADVYLDWPDDLPICPVCRAEWRKEHPKGDSEQVLAEERAGDDLANKKGTASYGRASVVLTRTELAKLFGANVNVVRAEYIDSDEILLITIEKEGLPRWHEGCRPYRVGGRLTGGSYIMADFHEGW